MHARERMHDHEHGHVGPERGHHRHHQEFGPPWGGWGRMMREFGPPRGARRARRGDVRTAVLALLDEKPMHGYDVIRELEERSGGVWQPSPGSVYPTLQLLEDQGLLTSEEIDGKRIFSITDEGKAELSERRERAGGATPWEMKGGESHEAFTKLLGAMGQLGGAVMQVARAGNPTQVDRVFEVLTEARKKVYSILAED